MRYAEFASHLVEAATQPLDKNSIVSVLKAAGFNQIKDTEGSKITILTDVPDGANKGEHRKEVMRTALGALSKQLAPYNPQHATDRKFGSLGGIVFDNSPFYVLVKDTAKQGAGSAGKLNEENLRSMLQILIMEYGEINVTFVDSRGKKLSIQNCNSVVDASMTVTDRQKADLILSNKNGKSLPISLKKVDADMWESADSLFGERAKQIIAKLRKEGAIKLNQLSDKSGTFYQLQKEIVVEPTQEETMNAIFGSDLLNKGGVVVQTFKDENFRQEGPNLMIECEYVIQRKEDIPTSHLMVWLIRNNRERNNPLPGLRTLGVTLTRGIGKTGTKDAVLVDTSGNVVQNPNIRP
jgi:hypothetical protein